MTNTKRPGGRLGRWAAAASLLPCLALPAHAQAPATGAPALTSPKDGDDFEVTRPCLFWAATPGAKRYEVLVDGARVGDAPAGPGPILHYGLTKPLAVGPHHWTVKAVLGSKKTVASAPSSFTVDPPAAWPEWAIGPFVRYGGNPLIRPQGTGWQSLNTFNPGVLFDQGKFRMLYRAQARGSRSLVGYAEGPDEVTFKTNPDPLIDATEIFEHRFGAEDPRFYKYRGTYYTFYTGDKNGGVAECEATSPDGTHWTKLGVIEDRTKNAAVICDPNGTPVKINGKFVMYTGDTHFHICYSDDMTNWGPMTPINIPLPATWKQSFEVCVAVADYDPAHPDNIVVFIGGPLNGQGRWFYSLSETLFSKQDLTKEVDVLPDSIMKPREAYESGQNPTCLWMNGIIQHDGQWLMYYGAGDRNIGLATAPVK